MGSTSSAVHRSLWELRCRRSNPSLPTGRDRTPTVSGSSSVEVRSLSTTGYQDQSGTRTQRRSRPQIVLRTGVSQRLARWNSTAMPRIACGIRRPSKKFYDCRPCGTPQLLCSCAVQSSRPPSGVQIGLTKGVFSRGLSGRLSHLCHALAGIHTVTPGTPTSAFASSTPNRRRTSRCTRRYGTRAGS